MERENVSETLFAKAAVMCELLCNYCYGYCISDIVNENL